jgi:endonuclease/exonuclease/phosphatase family metal-dependent hydrolase
MIAVWLGAVWPAAAQGPLDSYKCYKAKDQKSPKFEKQSVSLSDQFGINDGLFDVKKPFLVCNPTAAVDVPLANPLDHLVCYKVKGPKLAPEDRPRVEVLNPLGTTQLEVVKPFVLCVPSAQTVFPAESAGQFFALTYNVAGLPEGISGSHPAVNTPIISPLLNAYDLVLVQESWQTPDPNPLAPLRVYHELLVAEANHPYKSVPAPLPLGTDPERPSAFVSDGLNRMSRLFFDTAGVVRRRWTNCHDSAADCLSLKGFSMARLVLTPGFTVDVYNLHMEAGGDPEDDQLRDDAVTQMGAFMSAISAGNAVIVGGDFNLHTNGEPDSSTFQRLLSENDLSDVCAVVGCPDPGRIDKFLFRNSDRITITPTSWELEDDVFIDGMGAPLSDHLPVAVNFSWQIDP